MVNKHMERLSTTLSIREMPIEIIMRYPYTPIRMAKTKTVTIPNVGKDAEKMDHSYIAGRKCKMYSHSRKQLACFL